MAVDVHGDVDRGGGGGLGSPGGGGLGRGLRLLLLLEQFGHASGGLRVELLLLGERGPFLLRRARELGGDLGGRVTRRVQLRQLGVGHVLGGGQLVDEVLAVAGGGLEVALALGGRRALAGEHRLERRGVVAAHVGADGVGAELGGVFGQLLLGLGQALLAGLDVGVGLLEVDRGHVVLLVELLELGVEHVRAWR